jgi:hypothetical protein
MMKIVNAAYTKNAVVSPCQFSSNKVLDFRIRTGFHAGAMPRSTPAPHPGTLNGGEGIKMIRYLPYLPIIATADFFLFPRVKSELGDL